ncbi:Hypothetical_protein [Hexamita inflata]|uniref:Hypothetical_protein n=1 Tax=Hexamita inflata TaxID=28002 RepID=A0AA86QDU2_9EUKA|nr:Hypothetical protein HINF_LOCUS45094 [Hexamita inflata]
METQFYICGLNKYTRQAQNQSRDCFLQHLSKVEFTEKEVIDFATNLFSKYGFTINEKKCFSTANDNVITFDGINISSTENDPRLHTSKKLIQTAEEIYSQQYYSQQQFSLLIYVITFPLPISQAT